MSTSDDQHMAQSYSATSETDEAAVVIARRPLRGAAAAQAGFDYQLDVSILAALQLLLISKAASRLVLEPANDEDLEADLAPHAPGRVEPSAVLAGGYKLVVQVKLDGGEPWSVSDFDALLNHGSDRKGGRRKALEHLNDPDTRYLLVTSADAKGVARGLLVEGFEEPADKDKFPADLKKTLKNNPEGRVAIWGKLTEKQLAAEIRTLMSDLLHVPKVEQDGLLATLRAEAKRRTRSSSPGIWTREDLLATVRAHGGFLASSASLEHFVPPANFDDMVKLLAEKGAVVIRGPSGSGKTQAALKLCDLVRERDGTIEIVTVGADDAPTIVRKVVDRGPTLFYVDDPWGQYSLRGGAEAWTEQLPRLLAKAAPGHQFVITSRSDMMRSANVGTTLEPWSLELDADHYRSGQLRQIHDNRMDQLPPALQSMAFAFRGNVLDRLETPLEIELYFTHMQSGPDDDEKDHVFFQRLLELAKRDAVEDVVVKVLDAIDISGTAAVVWALLGARGQFDRGQLYPLQRALRRIDSALGEGLEKLIDRMVAARHLRQPARTIAFAHPSVRQGFEAFLRKNWVRNEAAINSLVSALTQLPEANRGWGLETAARVVDVARRFASDSNIDQPFDVDADSQNAIDAWLDDSLSDATSKFAPLLELASEVGTDASIPSRVARWLLKGTQRGASVFISNWQPPVFDDAWYDVVSADPVAADIAARFIREELGFDRGNYGRGFAARLDRFAPNLTPAYLDAARRMVGSGFEMNADAVAAGAVRDVAGFESVVQASLDDLATIHRQHAQHGREEWRAIEDGERDCAAEEAIQWRHEGDGYTSGVFIDAYITQLRSEGRWQVVADHPRVAEMVYAWSQALLTSSLPASEAEIRAILAAGKGLDAESNVWAAVRKHWYSTLQPDLELRICDSLPETNLRDELALTALSVAPAALLTAFGDFANSMERQVTLLADLQRARIRLGKRGAKAKLTRVTSGLTPELAEILGALPTRRRKARAVGTSALMLLVECAPKLDAQTLGVTVPIIIESGGDASPAIGHWLTVASSKDQALLATEAAITVGDSALIECALRHARADARRAAMLYLAPTLPDPLPPTILAMAGDPGSRVRRALISVLAERPHPDHLQTLLTLLHDTWSSAEPQYEEADSYLVAQEAVAALPANAPFPDAVGDILLHLADSTADRTLSQYALIVAAHCCSTAIQQKMSNLVTIPEARWIRIDALDALADADTVAPGIIANLTPAFLLKSPPILAASAAHLIGTHASPPNAVKLFERIASSNKRRALLLVGANAMASRDRAAADRIIDLLEPDHPGRQLLAVEKPLPTSILDDLGSVQLREAVRKRLGDRIAPSSKT